MPDHKIVLRFDPELRVADGALRRATSSFTAELEAHEAQLGIRTRERKETDRAKFQLAVEVMLSNLVLARHRSPQTLLNVPLSNTTLRGSPRYRPAVYGKHFRDLITLLERLYLIEMVTKGHNVREWNRREITRLRPTRKLLKAFPPMTAAAACDAFVRIDPPETIVLKNSDGDLLDYRDTPETERWRGEIGTINCHLRSASIRILGDEGPIDEAGFLVEATARTLRRIFNNDDWSQGGRLYGGFWQTMSRDLRLHVIRIDNEPIANVDFKQFNLRLAYAMAEQKPPRGDLYAMNGSEATQPNWQALREGRKKLTNAMINGLKPLRRWPGETPEDRRELASCFPSGTTARMAADTVRAAHPAVSQYFESGKGLNFMRIESDILVATVLSLIARGITALPLHDAVLVPERHAMIAKTCMQRESRRRIGTAIPAEIKTAAD